MGKRKYHSVSLDQIEISTVLKKIDTNRIIVSIDAAKEDFFAGIADGHGQIAKIIKWQHPKQTRLFLEFVEALGDPNHVEFAIEPSGNYGDSLRWQLHLRHYKVYRISGKAVHDYREVYDGVASSHDAKSCALISELHSRGRSKTWPFSDDSRREFKAKCASLRAYEKAYQQNLSRLHALTWKHWPELTQYLKLTSQAAKSF